MEFIRSIFTLYIERSEWFLELLLQHMGLALIAIFISGTIGLSLGIWISEYQKFSTTIMGISNILYTIPAISLLGILIPLSGVGNTTAIIALSIYGVMPMIRNTYI